LGSGARGDEFRTLVSLDHANSWVLWFTRILGLLGFLFVALVAIGVPISFAC
jgi:hypothetical protein